MACLLLVDMSRGQVGPDDGFRVRETGPDAVSSEGISWPEGVARPGEHAGWRNQLLEWYFEQARFAARIDSVRWERQEVWVHPGPIVPLAAIEIEADAADWLPSFDSFVGQPASAARIESVMMLLLQEASRAGFLAARAWVITVENVREGLTLVLGLEQGSETRLDRVVLEGDDRTRTPIILSALGLRPGQLLAGVDLEAMRTMLASAGWHEDVLPGRFERSSDSTAVIIFPVRPLPPGRFDVVVGALPGIEEQPAQLIGSGHLRLHNAFGQGRSIEAAISRLPGQASSLLLSFDTPSPGGWPLRIQLDLNGHQQDSTWNQTRLGSRLLYRFDPTTWMGASFATERTRAGFSGAEIVGLSQLVPRSSSRMAGVTMQVERLDHPRYPRRGFRLETDLERGIRTSSGLERVGVDTLSVERSERRERLEMDLDVFAMMGGQLGFAAGVDVAAVRAARPDVSELLSLGGASSLRGYDENRFRGTTVGRAFVEGRWYVDRMSWGFLFLDAGWVAVDADYESGLPAILRESEGWHPGYGFGFVFSSAMGPLSLSYALNPETTFREGRIHMGLSFGL